MGNHRHQFEQPPRATRQPGHERDPFTRSRANAQGRTRAKTDVVDWLRHVDGCIQSFPDPTQAVPASQNARATRASRPRRPSVVQRMMAVHANEVYNADAMMVDGLGGGSVSRPSSLVSASDGWPTSSDTEKTAAAAALLRARRAQRNDAQLGRAFNTWQGYSMSAMPNPPPRAHPPPRTIFERRHSKRSLSTLSDSSPGQAYAHARVERAGATRPGGSNPTCANLRSDSLPSSYSDYTTRPTPHAALRLPPEVLKRLPPEIHPADAMRWAVERGLLPPEYGFAFEAAPAYEGGNEEDEYDIENLPADFLNRIPPGVTVVQAIHYAVKHGIVPPDFGKRRRPSLPLSMLSSEYSTHDVVDVEAEYDLDNLPEAFVSKIPPGVTKLQAIQYAVQHGLVPPDFGKRAPDGRGIDPGLGLALPRGITKEEAETLALQNGILPPSLRKVADAGGIDNLVTWSGPLSPSNPRNWSRRKKWATTVTVSLSTFVSNMASSMVVPLLPLIRRQMLGLHKPPKGQETITFDFTLVISVYILAFAFAPFIYLPCSELFGRRRLLQVGILVFLTFNLLCGAVAKLGSLVALRFFAALGAAAPMVVSGGYLTDMFGPASRTAPLVWFGMAPLLGPVLGPLVSDVVAESHGRWQPVFWVSSGIIGAVAVLVLLLPESYVPIILEAKAERLRRETGNENLVTVFDLQQESIMHRIARYIVRPLVLLTTEPIMILLGVLTATSFGQVYLLFAALPSLESVYYHKGTIAGSLHFLPFGLGFMGGAIVGHLAIDRVAERLATRRGVEPRAEFKLVGMAVASPLGAVALLGYGWALDRRVHWVVGDLLSFVFAACVSASFLSVQAYVVETFALLAGSAMTATVVLRSLAGFIFTMFASKLVHSPHIGRSFTGLAAFSAVVGVSVSFVLTKFGPRLRQRSAYARG